MSFTSLYTLEAATPAAGGSMIMPIILIGAMVLMFYLTSRSQKKQERQAEEMRNSIGIGDEITTIGGIIGRVVNKREDTIVIETSSDRTKMKLELRSVRSVDKKANEASHEQKPTTFKVKKQ